MGVAGRYAIRIAAAGAVICAAICLIFSSTAYAQLTNYDDLLGDDGKSAAWNASELGKITGEDPTFETLQEDIGNKGTDGLKALVAAVLGITIVVLGGRIAGRAIWSIGFGNGSWAGTVGPNDISSGGSEYEGTNILNESTIPKFFMSRKEWKNGYKESPHWCAEMLIDLALGVAIILLVFAIISVIISIVATAFSFAPSGDVNSVFGV